MPVRSFFDLFPDLFELSAAVRGILGDRLPEDFPPDPVGDLTDREVGLAVMAGDQLCRAREDAGEYLYALLLIPAGGEVDHGLEAVGAVQDLDIEDRLRGHLILTNVNDLDPLALESFRVAQVLLIQEIGRLAGRHLPDEVHVGIAAVLDALSHLILDIREDIPDRHVLFEPDSHRKFPEEEADGGHVLDALTAIVVPGDLDVIAPVVNGD